MVRHVPPCVVFWAGRASMLVYPGTYSRLIPMFTNANPLAPQRARTRTGGLAGRVYPESARLQPGRKISRNSRA